MNIQAYRSFLCFISILLCIIHIYYFYAFYDKNFYLPPPFIMDKNDLFMDFYNVSWWASSELFYSVFRGFYSPFNVFISNIINDPKCVIQSSPLLYRLCNPYLALIFFSIFSILSLFLLLFLAREKTTSVLLVLLFFVSMPFLFAFERANFIILGLFILSLLLITNNRYILVFLFSLLVNIKFYLFFPATLSMLRIKIFIIFMSFIFFFLLIFSFFIESKNSYLIPFNLFNFASGIENLRILWNSTSLFAYDLVLSKIIDNLIIIVICKIIFLIFFLFITIRFCIFMQYAFKNMISFIDIFFVSLVFLIVISSSPGFYAIILLFPYFVYLNNSNRLSNSSLIVICLLCIPNVYLFENLTFEFSSFIIDYKEDFGHTNIIDVQSLSLYSISVSFLIFFLFYNFTNIESYETNV